jgi:arylsulfatase
MEGGYPMKERPNLLFLLIDCLRADMCFGPDRPVKTPLIDSLVERGTAFTQAISVSTTTLPTVSTMLTGLYPFLHGVLEAGTRGRRVTALNPKCTTLQEILHKDGYFTRAMVTGPLLFLGLDRGFDEYSHRDGHVTLYTDWRTKLKETIRDCGSREPWFLFLHLFELHTPRVLLRRFNRRRYGKNRYQRALSCLDCHLPEILDLVDLDRTIVLLHGDHGENYNFPPTLFKPLYTKPGNALNVRFGIRRMILRLRNIRMGQFDAKRGLNWVAHGKFLYEFAVRVPLIAVGEGIFPEGKIVDTQVSQIDIMPTILEAAGLLDRLDQRIHGRSLMPLAEGGSLAERPVLIESRKRVGIRTSRLKLIRDKSNPDMVELYDLKSDPTEDHNLADEEKGLVTRLTEGLKEIQSLDFPELSSEEVEITGEEQEALEAKLRALEYM